MSSFRFYRFDYRQLCRASVPIKKSVRHLSLFPQGKKEDESSLGVKTKDIVRVKRFFDEELKDGDKSKKFIETIEDFENIKKMKRFGYAEFVNAALPAMVEYGVHKDLEAYKSIMRVFPPGSFVPASKIASAFFPHVVQQRSAINILEQMEEYNVMPDKEFETIVIDAFSQYSEVWKKMARLNYWMTKLKNANVFPLPEKIPTDPLELAIVALKRMSIDPQSDVTVYRTSQLDESLIDVNSVEDTWICFTQSDSQQELINELDTSRYRVSLEGPFDAWVSQHSLKYFVLYARDSSAKKEVNLVEEQLRRQHENHNVSDIPLSNFGNRQLEEAINPLKQLHIQSEGTILSVVATGTSSHQSLVVWLKMFEKANPRLQTVPILMSNPDWGSSS